MREDSPTRPLQAPGGPPDPSPCPATESGGHLLPPVGLDDVRAISGSLHRSAALHRRCHRVVGLHHGDDLVRAIPIQATRVCRLTPQPNARQAGQGGHPVTRWGCSAPPTGNRHAAVAAFPCLLTRATRASGPTRLTSRPRRSRGCSDEQVVPPGAQGTAGRIGLRAQRHTYASPGVTGGDATEVGNRNSLEIFQTKSHSG